MAKAPVRRGSVLAFARRSRAAVELERRGERPGPTLLKRDGVGGSIVFVVGGDGVVGGKEVGGG